MHKKWIDLQAIIVQNVKNEVRTKSFIKSSSKISLKKKRNKLGCKFFKKGFQKIICLT